MNIKNSWIFLSFVLVTSSSAYADVGNGFGNYDHEMMWGFGMFGGIGMLLIWGLLIASIVIALKIALPESKSSRRSDALNILNERFANGDIDEDEYRRRKRVLDER